MHTAKDTALDFSDGMSSRCILFSLDVRFRCRIQPLEDLAAVPIW